MPFYTEIIAGSLGALATGVAAYLKYRKPQYEKRLDKADWIIKETMQLYALVKTEFKEARGHARKLSESLQSAQETIELLEVKLSAAEAEIKKLREENIDLRNGHKKE